ncbi:MAG: hypothetical protein ABIG44_11250 [Planctomycetota bacterium]
MFGINHFALGIIAAALIALCGTNLTPAQVYVPSTVHDVDQLPNGNILVTDGGSLAEPASGGIYEINSNGIIQWSHTTGLSWAHNADQQPNGDVIISDTGNDRVIIIDASGTIIWNTDNLTFSDGSSLDYPNDANLLASGNRLITDRDNHRVIEVDAGGNIVWQFGQTGLPGGGPYRLNGPHNADRLDNGHTIIADSNNNRILEVDPAGQIQWAYAGGLSWPRDADRLANGNTLINDSNNQRIIEVSPAGSVVWSYEVDDLSYDSDRLDSAQTLISAGQRIMLVDAAGETLWSYPAEYETEILEDYFVTAPNGNPLWTRLIQPRSVLYPDQTFPAIVSVSGGLGAGESGNAHLAQHGFVELHFNAQGRGLLHPSPGVEDCNGFVHQDDLKAVIEFAAGLPNVQTTNMGVMTGSYGITMGAGCLGRYPELPVKYLVDVEGPSDSYVTCFEPWSLDGDPTNDRHELAYQNFGHWSLARDPSPENEAWWLEREATRYIGQIRCRYLRAQAEWDHAQPPNAQWPSFDYPPLWWQCKHATDLVNLATTGHAAWTRINGAAIGNAPDQIFDHDFSPIYYSGSMQNHDRERELLVREMAAMPPLSTQLGDLNCDFAVNAYDIDPFICALSTGCDYARAYPDCNRMLADCNNDGNVDAYDIDAFIDLVGGG